MAKYNGNTGTGGIATEYKTPKDIKFKPSKESLLYPELVTCDSANADGSAQLHLGFQALHAFQVAHQRLPRPWNMYYAAEVLQLAKEKNAWRETDSRKLTRGLSLDCLAPHLALCAPCTPSSAASQHRKS
ncbi:hypothetical protein MTO96_014568 [Rhipicephalus appendiculatus]